MAVLKKNYRIQIASENPVRNDIVKHYIVQTPKGWHYECGAWVLFCWEVGSSCSAHVMIDNKVCTVQQSLHTHTH